jgi:hypothetical protein
MSKEKIQYNSIEIPDISDKFTDDHPYLSQDNTHDSEKIFPVENTEDVIKYSHLILEGKDSIFENNILVNRLLRYSSIIKNETKFLLKIKSLLSLDESMTAGLVDSLANGTPVFKRVQTKISYLRSVFESVSHHRAFLLDYAIMYLGAILHHMKILKNLDYRRVLYVRNQVSKCKTIIMNAIKDGCPIICKKYKETKYQSLFQELNAELAKENPDKVQDKVFKKIKTS